jgi:hypothetical protein
MLVLLAIFSECASPHLSLSAREETTQQGSDGEKTAASADNKRNKQAVLDWFQKYDAIRSDAEMTVDEKTLSKQLMRKAMLPLASAEEKEKASELALKMVERYSTALAGMQQLKPVPETAALQTGYVRYFTDSRELFEKLGHKFSKDKEERHLVKHLFSGLISGKKELAALDESNKGLDAKLRAEYGIHEHKAKSDD